MEQNQFIFLITSSTILLAIKARLRSNNWLLEVSSTQIGNKIGVLDGFSYPEFRFNSKYTSRLAIITVINSSIRNLQ